MIEKSKFLNSVPDIKYRQASLWVALDEHKAVQEMLEAIRTAKIVSQAHHKLNVDRARLLSEEIQNPDARARLLEAVGNTYISE
ncbi:MAG: hypothetical protein Kow0063_42280 [Anaerolineae bacterium]